MARIILDDETPLLVHEVGGYRYSFSVRDFPKEQYNWLCKVLGEQMDEIYQRARYEGDKLRRDAIKEALGIK